MSRAAVSGWTFTGSAPRRMVPPRSETSFCSGRRSITGHSVSMSNSVEFAPGMPATWRGGGPTGDVAGELAHRDLHAQADAQVRDLLLARDLDGADLALDPATAEPAGDEDAVDAGEALVGGVLVLERLRVDPVDLDPAAVQVPGVAQRLADREIGVLELHV